jgi:hypothetical protein
MANVFAPLQRYSVDNLGRAVTDIRTAMDPGNDLGFGGRLASMYGGLAGIATVGTLPDMGLTEKARAASASRALQSVASESYDPQPGPEQGAEYRPQSTWEEDLRRLMGSIGLPGGGGAAAETYEPDIQFIPGDPRGYDLNDPGQRAAYFNKRLELAQGYQSRARGEIEDAYRRASETSRLTKEANDAELARRRAGLDDSEAAYLRQFSDRSADFQGDFRSAGAARQGAFAAASPNAFQSAQADSARLARGEYEEGLSDLSLEKESNLKGFAADRAAVERQRVLQENAFANDAAERDNAFRKNLDAVDRSVADFKSGAAAQLAPYDAAAGITDFGSKYQLESYDPYQTKNADLSKYQAATSFSGLGSPSPATANAFALPQKGQDPQAAYLDEEKKKKEKDARTQYVYA